MSINGHILPERKMPTLIVVAAFNRYEKGDLKPAFNPRQMQSEGAAVRLAKMIETEHGEYAATDNILLRAEYRYTDYGSENWDEWADGESVDLNTHDIRLGVAYKF